MVARLVLHRRRVRCHRNSLDNPDFVDVVVHSYRHRYGLAAGGPACQGLEGAIALPTSLQLKTRPQGVDGTLLAVEFDSS